MWKWWLMSNSRLWGSRLLSMLLFASNLLRCINHSLPTKILQQQVSLLSLFFCYFFSLIWRINATAFTFSLFQFCLSPVCEKFKLKKLILEHLDFVCFSNSLKHVIFIYEKRMRRRSLLINYFIHNRWWTWWWFRNIHI